MYLLPLSRPLIAAVLFMLLSSASALAAASVSVNPTGDLSYTVEGTGMDGVAGIQLDITYDATSLNIPKTTQGPLVAGAMFAANTTRPGLIKIAVISSRPFSGSGQIASITFASKTGTGGITSVTTNMIDSKGASLASTTGNQQNETAAPGTDSTPGVPFSQSPQTTLSGQTGTIPAPTLPGSVTLPAEQQQAGEQPEPSSTDPAFTAEPEPATTAEAEQSQPSNAPPADAKAEETPQYVVYKGISDRFRQYSGAKSLSAMAELFNKKVAQSIHQEPTILLSDGKSSATLTIDIPARVVSSPNFAAKGGTLVSFIQDKQNKRRWTVEVHPEKGAIKTTLTIIAGAEEFEYPLTVAPPAKNALTLDEAGWNRFLKETGTTNSPLHDMNNDGIRNYMDEYIFVANHLAKKPAEPVKKTAQ